ncbi:conserved hypothetical protein [Hyella patelloides LEGE 07179]|uniref:Uncharacterized protein n=1 Tax=Hyella patelloides LEGE 07179 TaxID=945734 RepID=A0A563W439_9CYAN|nr:hypothetical protein [Hyella patelloides]VEP18462.1 conserved hypothetical protein [Hyella patelloides LEGE 07179]
MDRESAKSNELAAKLQQISTEINQLAEQNQDDILFLLALLRDLEKTHRQIRTTMFENSLPKTRNDLYNLVKDIEEQGGWPYIERMRLRKLLKNMDSDFIPNSSKK